MISTLILLYSFLVGNNPKRSWYFLVRTPFKTTWRIVMEWGSLPKLEIVLLWSQVKSCKRDYLRAITTYNKKFFLSYSLYYFSHYGGCSLTYVSEREKEKYTYISQQLINLSLQCQIEFNYHWLLRLFIDQDWFSIYTVDHPDSFSQWKAKRSDIKCYMKSTLAAAAAERMRRPLFLRLLEVCVKRSLFYGCLHK